MALFIQKPIFWNSNNYEKPSGHIGASGFPEECGFGHEEWNNSSRMLMERDEGDLRFFHTEVVRHSEIEENAGQTFVFMTASHDGIQQFVGIAANATAYMAEEYEEKRREFADELSLFDLSGDAWSLDIVQEKYEGNYKRFLKNWKKDLHWIPNWSCPDSYYWWFDEPISIDPQVVRRTQRWLGMFSSYTELTAKDAIKIMELIPKGSRSEKWDLIFDAILSSSNEQTPVSLQAKKSDSTNAILVKQYLAAARIGQGIFRQALLDMWNNECAVTGLNCHALLKASHIKPWVKSNNKEKLDRYNGLLLSSNLDSLFDKGLISFEDDGSMLVSSLVSKKSQKILGLPQSLTKKPDFNSLNYLKFHRDSIFQV